MSIFFRVNILLNKNSYPWQKENLLESNLLKQKYIKENI